MMFIKPILAVSFAALTLAAPSIQRRHGGLGADVNVLLDNLGDAVDDLLTGGLERRHNGLGGTSCLSPYPFIKA